MLNLPRRQITFLLGVLLMAGCGKPAQKEEPQVWVKVGSAQVGSTVPEEKPVAKVDLTKDPEFRLEAAAWMAEWKKDREATRKKYLGKVVEISGTVNRTSQDPYGDVGYVFLKVEGEILGVRCCLADKEPWLKVSPGSMVKVRGTHSAEAGLAGDVYPCAIVEASPSPALVITASALAKAFGADARAAQEKYGEKWLLIDGEIAGLEKDKNPQFLLMYLKAENDIKIKVILRTNSDHYKKRNESIKAGQKVKMLGQVRYFDKEITIDDIGVSIQP